MFEGVMASTLAALCLLLLLTGAQGFGILPGKSLNHLEITETAILKSAVQVCRSLALTEGTGFTTPVRLFLTFPLFTLNTVRELFQ